MSGILQNFAYGRTFSSIPVNTVAPVVSGTATFGQTLSCTTGTWTGVPTPTYTYQWQRVTTPISGATSSTYVLVQADVGSTIRCVVTATNVAGAVSANSNSTATVAATVPGAPTIGTATATSSSTATVAYTAPASNGGATITTYTATSSPGGFTGTLSTAGSGTITVTGLSENTSYTFTVRATNSIGQSAASSASNSITTPVGYWITYTGDRTTWNAKAALRFQLASFGFDVTPNGYSVMTVWTSPQRATYFGVLNPDGTKKNGYYATSGGTNGYFPNELSVANLNANKSSADYCVVANGNYDTALWNATTGSLVGSYSGINYSVVDNKGNVVLSSGNIVWTSAAIADDKAGVSSVTMYGLRLGTSILIKANGTTSIQVTDSSKMLNTILSDNSIIQFAANFAFLFTADCATRTAVKVSPVGVAWGLGSGEPSGITADSSNNLYVIGDLAATTRISKINSAFTTLTRYEYTNSICSSGYGVYGSYLYTMFASGGDTIRLVAINTSTMAVYWAKVFTFTSPNGSVQNVWASSDKTGLRVNSLGVFMYFNVPDTTNTYPSYFMRAALSGPSNGTYSIGGDRSVTISTYSVSLSSTTSQGSIGNDAQTWQFTTGSTGSAQTLSWATNASVLPTATKTPIL